MTERVLIVEESLTVRMHLGDALERAGFAVATVVDANAFEEVFGADAAAVLLGARLFRAADVYRQASETGVPVLLVGNPAGDLDWQPPPDARWAGDPQSPEVIVAAVREEVALSRAAGPGVTGQVPYRAPKGTRVLAVDDSPTFLHATRETLQPLGFETLLAQSGDEAFDVLSREAVDVILLDLLLPGISGLDVCRQLKSDPKRREIPVVMLTGRGDAQAVVETLDAGADDFVSKADPAPVLIGRLNAQLRRRDLETRYREVREQLLGREMDAREARAQRALADIRARLLSDLERKNAELERARSEAVTILESISDAFFSIDPEWRFIYVNGAAERIFGRSRTELMGRPLAAVFPTEPEEGEDTLLRAFRGALDHGAKAEFEETFFGRWFEVHAYPSEAGLSVYFRDVTEQRQARDRLQASEERFRLLVEGVHDHALFLLDPEGRVESWNAGAQRLTGWASGEILGRRWALFHVSEDLAAQVPEERLQAADQRGRWEGESLWLRHDNTRFWANVLLTPLREPEGRTRGFAVVLRDVSERRRVEDYRRLLLRASRKLAESLQYEWSLSQVLELVVPDFARLAVAVVVDGSGEVEQVFTAMDETRERGLSEAVREALAPPDAVERLFGSTRPVRTSFSQLPVEGLRGLPGDGVGGLLVLSFQSQGRILGGLLVGREGGGAFDERDVAYFEELTDRMSLAVEKAALYREAQDAIAARNEFLSIASHELRTPLTTLKLQTRSILRRGGVKSLPPDRLSAKVDMIDRQVERLEGLVDRLLNISRITQQRLEMTREEVDLVELVGEVVSRHEDEAARAGCDVRVRMPPSLVGQWDRLRLDQVVTNLLSNAIKYGPGAPIEVVVEGNEDIARLRVRDLGIGIAAEDQARIFERFERAVSTRHYGGFGLGLWIVRQIVNALGGEISVESTPGEGSTFIVELPLDPSLVEAEPASGASPRALG